jgi:hypothetical protein
VARCNRFNNEVVFETVKVVCPGFDTVAGSEPAEADKWRWTQGDTICRPQFAFSFNESAIAVVPVVSVRSDELSAIWRESVSVLIGFYH